MATKQQPRSETKRPPVHEIRLGRLRAAIWEHETQYGPRYNVTTTRSFRDGDGQWQQSQSYGRDDLLPLAKLLDLAHTWIVEQAHLPAEANADDGSGEDAPY